MFSFLHTPWFLAALTLLMTVTSGCGGSTSGDFRYVALGASDAAGIGASSPSRGYVPKIQDGLEADGRDVGLTNLGIPGADAREIKNISLPIAVESDPELVTVFAGPNDIIGGVTVEEFRDDLRQILRELAEQTAAVVVVATIPNLTALPRFQEEPDADVTVERVMAFNNVINEEAASFGQMIADLAGQPVSAFEVSDDGFHPSDAGHQTIADVFLGVIRTALPPAQLED